MDYRSFLQNLANSNNGEAQALLHVVGNDFGIDQGFANQQLVNGAYNWQAPQGVPYDPEYGQVQGGSKWYGPSGVGTLNEKYKGMFQPDSGSTPGATSTGGTDGESGADLAYLDSQSSALRRLLESAQDTKRDSLTSLGDSYNQEVSGANLSQSRALENFGLQREDTQNAKQDALGAVDTNARTLADQVRRLLGMASGSSSSAYQLAAPNAIGRHASQQRDRVMGTYGKNFRDLDLSEKRTNDDFASMLQELAAQKQQKESGIRSGVLSQEQGIMESLASIAAEKARISGGGYESVMAAQQPFANEINSRQSQLDNLFEQFRTPYSVKPVNVQTPQLADYTVDKAAINANNQAGGGSSTYSPYSYFLKRDQEEEQRV